MKEFEEYENTINEAYEHMVFWKKNLFRLPSNSAGKQFVHELTKLINCWLSKCPIVFQYSFFRKFNVNSELNTTKVLKWGFKHHQRRAFIKKTRTLESGKSKRTLRRMYSNIKKDWTLATQTIINPNKPAKLLQVSSKLVKHQCTQVTLWKSWQWCHTPHLMRLNSELT